MVPVYRRASVKPCQGSQLCWPVPDRYIRLSIDIKLCDDHLRSVAAEADDDEAVYGDDVPETDGSE